MFPEEKGRYAWAGPAGVREGLTPPLEWLRPPPPLVKNPGSSLGYELKDDKFGWKRNCSKQCC